MIPGRTGADRPRNVYQFLESIRPRLNMYVANRSILVLEFFLQAYQSALWVHLIEEKGVPDSKYFPRWLAQVRDGSWSRGWASGLVAECEGDNEAALNLFFELVAEFAKLTTEAGAILQLSPTQGRSQGYMRLNPIPRPVPARVQLMHLRPGDWCYLRYWYSDDWENQWSLHPNLADAWKSVEWEFGIQTNEWNMVTG